MRPPMVLVGHGTRTMAGQAAFHAMTERIRHRAGDAVPVAGCFLELSRPSIAETVTGLCRDGARHLIVVPLLLLAAGHYKQDIPGAVRCALVERPEVGFGYARPLGPHPLLVDLLTRRIEAVLPGAGSGAPGETAVVLAGQGSTDPDHPLAVSALARTLGARLAQTRVDPAYLTSRTPDLETALDQVASGGAGRIVIAQHLLFPGVLSDAIHRVAAAWAARHPQVMLTITDRLWPEQPDGHPRLGRSDRRMEADCDALADLVLERYHEARRSGDQ